MKNTIRCLLILAIFTHSLVFYSAPKASSLSDSIAIYQLQTAGAISGTASQELILLLNTSAVDVDVTNWCVQYSSSADSAGFKKCLTPIDLQTKIWVQSGGLISFASAEFMTANPDFLPDIVFSAGMAATGGHLRLLNAVNVEIDKVGWGTAVSPEGTVATVHTTGKVLSRALVAPVIDTDENSLDFSSQDRVAVVASGLFEVVEPVDLCPNIESVQTELPVGYLFDDDLNCQLDICPNLDDLQITVPEGYQLESESCTHLPLETRPILITELYPNAPSYDTGNEFIELYNPHDSDISLNGYTLQVGPDFTKTKIFTDEIIGAKSYLAISDTATGITLPNTNGVVLRLRNQAGELVYETPLYTEIAETTSWAIVDDQWIITNQITPGGANLPFIVPADDEVLGISTVLAPCPLGKYRNPETNRCRTIETAVSTLIPCDEDEYRNPDTNRCRKLVSSASALISCDEGEERNPDTNRCRKITATLAKTTDDLAEIKDVAVDEASGSFDWRLGGAVVAGAIAYILYEWRDEIRRKVSFRRST